MGPAFFIHWKAHPIETQEPEHRYGRMSLLYIPSRAIMVRPHIAAMSTTPPPGKNGYYREGLVFPRGYEGRVLDVQVLSPFQSRRGNGEHVLTHGIDDNGGKNRARRVNGLRGAAEVYVTTEIRDERVMVARMSYEVAITKSAALGSRLTTVLPRVGVDQRDVAHVRQELLMMFGLGQ
jgi:hypothetical protein